MTVIGDIGFDQLISSSVASEVDFRLAGDTLRGERGKPKGLSMGSSRGSLGFCQSLYGFWSN